MSIICVAMQVAGLFGMISGNLLLKTLTASTETVYKRAIRIANLDCPYAKDYTKVLEELDLAYKVNIMTNYINEKMPKDTNFMIPNAETSIVLYDKNSNAVMNAVNGVLAVLENINKGLRTVENSIQYHNTKYFCGWRSFKCDYSISDIRKDNGLLESRTKLLFRLL